MGCVTSKLEPSDVVQHCKERKRLLKHALKYRQNFALSHFAYIQTLRSVGLALRRFAEGDIQDSQASPRTPTTPVAPVPHVSSTPVAVLSPPASASTRSPEVPSSPTPVSTSSPVPPPLANGPGPSFSPSRIPATPRQSPRLSSPQQPVQSATPLQDMPDVQYLNAMASPERGSDFSPPFYSPDRNETDDFFSTYSPSSRFSRSPPVSSSPLSTASWFPDIFNAPPIPYHLQEQRRMKQTGQLEDDDEIQDFDQVQKEEGIPDLEEEELKEEVSAVPEQASEIPGVTEAAVAEVEETRVIPNEKEADVSELKTTEATDTGHAEDKPVVMKSVSKEAATESSGKKIPKQVLSVATGPKGRNLIEAVKHIHGQFTRASRSGAEVSQLLQIKMVHHSILEDSSKVFNAITMHWSQKTSSIMRDAYEDSGDEHANGGMHGSHALILERLYAWEKKLYDEVKAGELIQTKFNHKNKHLHNLQAKGEDEFVLDQTRAVLRKLDTRLIVALKAIRSVSEKIQRLTDDDLLDQLCELLGGLTVMWKEMLECHRAQRDVALEMQTLENSVAGNEASEAHRKATIELEHELEKWQHYFQRWIESQKEYIGTLHEWSALCHNGPKGREPNEDDATEKSQVCVLLETWHSTLNNLDMQERVVDSIRNFSTVVHSLETEQSLELDLKKEAEISARDLDRKTVLLKKLERKYVESEDETDKAARSDSKLKVTLLGKRHEVDRSRATAEDDKNRHRMAVQGRKEATLNKLRENLPTVFDSIAMFAEQAARGYLLLDNSVKDGGDTQTDLED